MKTVLDNVGCPHCSMLSTILFSIITSDSGSILLTTTNVGCKILLNPVELHAVYCCVFCFLCSDLLSDRPSFRMLRVSWTIIFHHCWTVIFIIGQSCSNLNCHLFLFSTQLITTILFVKVSKNVQWSQPGKSLEIFVSTNSFAWRCLEFVLV